MGSRIIRSIAYVTTAALLLAVCAALLANFNVQTARAGGTPLPLYQLFSDKITADANFTIHTTTAIGGINTYLVHSHLTGTDYNVAILGTDYICIHKAGTSGTKYLCIPYSAIAGVNF